MVPTKHIGRTQVLMKGKQFLLPITHPPYFFSGHCRRVTVAVFGDSS
jgi:hypothetical protein